MQLDSNAPYLFSPCVKLVKRLLFYQYQTPILNHRIKGVEEEYADAILTVFRPVQPRPLSCPAPRPETSEKLQYRIG